MNKIMTFVLLAVALLAMAASVPALAQKGSRGSSSGGSSGGSYGSYRGGSHGGYHGGSHGGYHGYPRVGIGFGFVGPAYWGYPGWGYSWWDYPGYYYPPPYYYPRAVAVPAEPTAYIERSDANSPPEQSQGNWYYYCPEAKAYYPYLKQCAGGWQRVSPTPPGENK